MRQATEIGLAQDWRSEVRRLFDLQAAARWTVSRSTAAERRKKLERLKAALHKHRPALAEGIVRDFGRAPEESELVEFHPIFEELNHAIAQLGEWMRPEPVDSTLLLADTASEIRWEAKGQVLVLSPWNYPVYLVLGPLAGAIAAGNVVIVKPSEKVPETNRALRGLLVDAFPENEVAMVEGEVPVAEALLDLPFDHIFFTGSTRVGKLVMAAAAKHLASVTLELGGKSPAIVAPDANIARAAQAIAWGSFVNAGQTCIAPDYALVQEGQRQPLLDGLRAAIERSYGPESGWSNNPDFARLVDPGAFSRLKGLMDDAVRRGAKVVIGGEANASERYLAPTVLVDVPEDAPLLQEEIFGPLLPVVTYRTLEDALEYVRRRPKPLALYLFSRSGSTVEETLRGTTSGGVCINNTLIHLANPRLPFGGVGPSGIGSYHGRAGFRAFSHERAVMRQQGNPLARLLAPPYRGRMNRMVARFARFLQ